MPQAREMNGPDYFHDAAVALMNFLDGYDWEFHLRPGDSLVLTIGGSPPGLTQQGVLAILAVLRPACESAIATRVTESETVQ